MRTVGDKVFLNFGGYGGLNFMALRLDGYEIDKPVEIVEVDNTRSTPYKVVLPNPPNKEVWISERDIEY